MNVKLGDCVLDRGQRRLLRGESDVHLSPKAFQLLTLLVDGAPNAVSKQEIYDILWPSTFVSDTSLPSLVLELRKALGDDARQPRYIRTVHGFGYAFALVIESGAKAKGAPSRFRLLIAGSEVALAGSSIDLGRTAEATIFLDDTSVSRSHARITEGTNGATIEDLGSKNGTFVNDERVTAPVALRDRDVIRIGSVVVVFRDSAAAEPTRTMH